MTVALLDRHRGHHCAPHRAPFFRRVISMARRKPALPAALAAAGAAAALLADAPRSPVTPDRYATETLAWAEIDQWLSEVRAEHAPGRHAPTEPISLPAPRLRSQRQRDHAEAMHAAALRYLPPAPRPVNGRPMPDQPRRTLDPVPVLAGAELGEARAAAQAAGTRVRAGRQPASSDLLERVLTDLRKWR